MTQNPDDGERGREGGLRERGRGGDRETDEELKRWGATAKWRVK